MFRKTVGNKIIGFDHYEDGLRNRFFLYEYDKKIQKKIVFGRTVGYILHSLAAAYFIAIIAGFISYFAGMIDKDTVGSITVLLLGGMFVYVSFYTHIASYFSNKKRYFFDHRITGHKKLYNSGYISSYEAFDKFHHKNIMSLIQQDNISDDMKQEFFELVKTEIMIEKGIIDIDEKSAQVINDESREAFTVARKNIDIAREKNQAKIDDFVQRLTAYENRDPSYEVTLNTEKILSRV